eukprot:m.27387 g.27387  ORF g.27387 m.27387 type:complete len:318 (+) comp4407_c0_seq1:114-1067(+)
MTSHVNPANVGFPPVMLASRSSIVSIRATPFCCARRMVSTNTVGTIPPRPPLYTEQTPPCLLTATRMWPLAHASSSMSVSTTCVVPIWTSETSTGNCATSRGIVSSKTSKSTASPPSSRTSSVLLISVHARAARTANPHVSTTLPPAHSRTTASTCKSHTRAPGIMHKASKSSPCPPSMRRLNAETSSCDSESPPRLTNAGEAPAEQSTLNSIRPWFGYSVSGFAASSLTPTRTSVPPTRTRADPLVFEITPRSITQSRMSTHCLPSARKFCATPSSMYVRSARDKSGRLDGILCDHADGWPVMHTGQRRGPPCSCR